MHSFSANQCKCFTYIIPIRIKVYLLSQRFLLNTTSVHIEKLECILITFFQEDKSKKDSSKVKKLYHELNLKQVFKDYEEESYKNILELISQKSGNLPEGLFLEFVKKIYKRNKWAIVLQTRFIIIERPLHCHFDWQ